MTTTIRRCGESALLLDCADLAHAMALAQELGRLRPEAVDVVPAARTVLVTARDAAALPDLRERVEEVLGGDDTPSSPTPSGPTAHAGPGAGAGPGVVTIDVRYDGPDLADVADLAGLSVEALVRRHTSTTWRAAFGGFAPGFFYLVDERELGGDPGELPAIPRLGTPRARVPAGSVGLADRFSAVYPGVSPGGWRLIGTTDARLWDLDRPEPALLAPGVAVRFRDAGETRERGDQHSDPGGRAVP